jgi:hypothetical protein
VPALGELHRGHGPDRRGHLHLRHSLHALCARAVLCWWNESSDHLCGRDLGLRQQSRHGLWGEDGLPGRKLRHE